jgi:uncharacterized coiled-coil DUF342 family protein
MSAARSPLQVDVDTLRVTHVYRPHLKLGQAAHFLTEPAPKKPPAKLAESPEKTTESPEKTTELPEKMTELPEKTTELPEKTTELPEKTTELPEKTTELPEKTTELPEKTTASSAKMTKSPEKTTESPVLNSINYRFRFDWLRLGSFYIEGRLRLIRNLEKKFEN